MKKTSMSFVSLTNIHTVGGDRVHVPRPRQQQQLQAEDNDQWYGEVICVCTHARTIAATQKNCSRVVALDHNFHLFVSSSSKLDTNIWDLFPYSIFVQYLAHRQYRIYFSSHPPITICKSLLNISPLSI
jgi:hypothetical protein